MLYDVSAATVNSDDDSVSVRAVFEIARVGLRKKLSCYTPEKLRLGFNPVTYTPKNVHQILCASWGEGRRFLMEGARPGGVGVGGGTKRGSSGALRARSPQTGYPLLKTSSETRLITCRDRSLRALT